MEPLKVREYPDKILRKKCLPVGDITQAERALFKKMLLTMRYYSGIGLAAPQIGIDKNLIVADVGQGVISLANPVILKSKGSDRLEEGCLSVPGVGVAVTRAYEAIVSGWNEKGKSVEIKAEGLLARVLQHEIDHLNGKLIIDYASLLEKMRLFKASFGKAKDGFTNS